MIGFSPACICNDKTHPLRGKRNLGHDQPNHTDQISILLYQRLAVVHEDHNITIFIDHGIPFQQIGMHKSYHALLKTHHSVYFYELVSTYYTSPTVLPLSRSGPKPHQGWPCFGKQMPLREAVTELDRTATKLEALT